VRFILGTPVLMDMFHANRWDYFYWHAEGERSGEVETRRFSVFFDADGKLIGSAGDVAPAQPTDRHGDRPGLATARNRPRFVADRRQCGHAAS
jgi:outer membrane protein assembly factor BamE